MNTTLTSRYLTLEHLNPWIDQLATCDAIKLSNIGKSVLNKSIPCIIIGTGPYKILGWSQMHGNESTTTKMLVSIIQKMCTGQDEQYRRILERCTLCVVPILNPDGAEAYTRENANKMDLNRDAVTLSQPESIALRDLFDSFKPDLCLNLHGQRSIYGLVGSSKPAAVSFLAPAYDVEKSVNPVRLKAMELIVGIYKELQDVIPGMIGRYDDTFNKNCVGDTFQGLNSPTILFEAGHLDLDYQRNNTAKVLEKALKAMLLHVSGIKRFEIPADIETNYNQIPENSINYCDLLVENIYLDTKHSRIALAVQYKEELHDQKILFKAELISWGNHIDKIAHKTIDFKNKSIGYSTELKQDLDEFIADYVLKNFSR